MAEELAFARKASGLVRGLSMTDAFAVGFMNQGITPSIGLIFTTGLGLFFGANLVLAAVISFVLAGIGFPLVWGVLGGSMPRSGGEYVYNSRIIHPIFGIGQSFGDAVIWLMWLYVLAPLISIYGLSPMASYLGYTGAADTLANSNWAILLVASVFNLIGFLFVVFGIKIFALTQKVVMFFSIGGAIVIGLVYTFTSQATFIAHWNEAAAASGSPRYAAFIAQISQAAGEVIPSGWNWTATIGVMAVMSWLFAYAYSISFIAGEVKRPDKTIIWANVFAVVVPFVFMLWIGIVAQRTTGYQFMQAASWMDNNGAISNYNMPFATDFLSLAVYGLGASSAALGAFGKFLAAWMALSYVGFTLWWLALSYLAFPRILFAWGMDRMGPKWFTDINPRFASPVKNHVLCFVLSEILLVIYMFSSFAVMQNLVVTGLQVTSVFLPTAIAALLFPYMRRSKGIWDSSPYKTWTFLGLPVVVWGALVDIAYLAILLYAFIGLKAMDLFDTAGYILFVSVWVVGILWYLFWKQRSKSVGVDVSLTYGELPPE
jgi:APA family basic amino acid/polyamine antiporter